MELTIKISIPENMMTKQAAQIAEPNQRLFLPDSAQAAECNGQCQIADGRAFRRAERRTGC